jgi:Tol biopolymer transport system component
MFLISLSFENQCNAQYFNGPNKPTYRIINYKVYKTPHFEIYYYFNNDSVLNSLSELAEKWYLRHQMIFNDTFKTRNPILFYANHADFEQTNAVMGNIGLGTGGVTEGFKNRVVLPIMESAAQTDHVLGHELVHAFQYRFLMREDSLQLRNIRNMPLWMIEGMAEYLSIGDFDPNTAMWMRDAIINRDFPTLDDLTRSYKYFPYRYGEAFWAYFAGKYGDTSIIKLFDLTSKFGYEKALDSLTHKKEKAFSKDWRNETKHFYFKFLKDTVEKPIGKKILSRKNSGTMNISPSLSPDGKYVIFLSEKDLFTFDLFLANASNGKIIRKLSSTIRDNRIDDFNFLESGGSWSPDGKFFVFVVFSHGRNNLMIINIQKPRKYKEIKVEGVPSISNPSWSPDGKSIAFTGLVEGVTDIYNYTIETGKVENLTNDSYCNLIPTWSPDGKYIAFSTDRPLQDKKDSTLKGYNLAIMDVQTKSIKILPVFLGAQNLNPQFSPDGKWLYFLSNADGFRNLYKYNIEINSVYRLTTLITGISGITDFAPAISVSREKGNIVYTHYFKTDYNLVQASDSLFKHQQFPLDSLNFSAGYLPPRDSGMQNIIDKNLSTPLFQNLVSKDSFKTIPYKPKFRLDYIGGSSMGVAMSTYYGTGMAGSIDMLFSDIVGNYQLYSSLSINGEVYDFAGSLAFINDKHKINYGVSLSHIPYRYYTYTVGGDTLYSNLLRIYDEAITLFAVKSLTQTQRVEAFSSWSYFHYRLDIDKYLYSGVDYLYLGREKNLPVPGGFGLVTFGTAYTLDNSFMGIASPLRGQRFRIETDYNTGNLNFLTFLLDYRRYFFLNPFSFATRFYHLGRYGSTTTNYVIQSLYTGWPWLVRGYENVGAYNPNSPTAGDANELFGSHIAVANLEFRMPFTGPERLCIIPSKYFVSELSFFMDAGLAWTEFGYFSWKMKEYINPFGNYKNITTSVQDSRLIDYSKYRYPMVSYGISLRINVFGVMILEPYYAFPLKTNGLKYGSLGLNFLPGW